MQLQRLRPMLVLTHEGKPAPVKTIPPHFAPVQEATKQDIALIFGDERILQNAILR